MSDHQLFRLLLPTAILSSAILGFLAGTRSTSRLLSFLIGWGACIGVGAVAGCLVAVLVDARAASMPGGNPWLGHAAGQSIASCALGAYFVGGISAATGLLSGFAAMAWVWRRTASVDADEPAGRTAMPRGLEITAGILVLFHAVWAYYFVSQAFPHKVRLLHFIGVVVSAAIVAGGIGISLRRNWGITIGAIASYVYFCLFALGTIDNMIGMGFLSVGSFGGFLGSLAPGYLIFLHWWKRTHAIDPMK